MQAIPFFSDAIQIIPHTATEPDHLNRPVSIQEFAGSDRVSLYKLENGELLARKPDGSFIEGMEYLP